MEGIVHRTPKQVVTKVKGSFSLQATLSQNERDVVMMSLTNEQRSFLHEHVRRGKRTMFARVLARLKGIHVTEDMTAGDLERFVNEWRFVDFIDGGQHFREIGSLKCECGRILRYQYIIEHRETGDFLHFGKQHFELHTGLPARVVKEIQEGFDGVDFELDELLIKLQRGWRLAFDIPNGFSIPEPIETQISLGIPLLERQVKQLRILILNFEDKRQLPSSGIRERVGQLPPDALRLGAPLEKPSLEYSDDDDELPLFPHVKAQKAFLENNTMDTTVSTGLSPQQQRFVLGCLDEGMESIRVMCELMIQRNLTSDSRYITGKPAIYPVICLFLEDLCLNSTLQCVGKSVEDRWYRYVHE